MVMLKQSMTSKLVTGLFTDTTIRGQTIRGHDDLWTCQFADKTFRWHANSQTGDDLRRCFADKLDYSRKTVWSHRLTCCLFATSWSMLSSSGTNNASNAY